VRVEFRAVRLRSLLHNSFDLVAAAYTFRPGLCPVEPMSIEVDAKGFTRKVSGLPNAQVCLNQNEAEFLKLLEGWLGQAGK